MNLTRSEAEQRASVVTRVESYEVKLDLTGSERTFLSETVVRFSAVPGSSTFIDAVTETVRSVTLNGTALDPAEVADGVRIQLTGLQEENELVVVADAAYTNTGEGLHRFVDPADGEVYLYTQFEVPDSRRMFAVFEQPDLKARFSFTVTAPEEWTLISNEPVEAQESAQNGTVWVFGTTPRISSYVTALVAGPYGRVEDSVVSSDGHTIELGLYTRRSLMEHLDTEELFTLTKQGFGFYEQTFGVAYPFTKYDQLFVPEFNAGAMENAGCVTILEDYVFRSKATEAMVERRAITVLHELAHMWFGDLVTMKWWNDLWLNESFAEFMSHLAAVEATRFTNAWTTFGASEKTWAYRQDQLPSTHPIVADIKDLQDVQVNFDGITYAKGASVLRQLVAYVGQDEFMRALNVYFGKHAWSNATLADLMSELEAASGRDLSEWSAAWLETAGVNTLTPSIEMAEDGTIAGIEIIQTAPSDYPTLRPHRTTLGFYDDVDGQLTRVHRVEFDVEGQRTMVPDVAGRKRPALVLLNDEDLAYAKVRLGSQSLRTAMERLRDIDDSLARAVVWGAAWNGTRDGQIPARSFVDLVLDNLGSETDSTTILTQLRNLATTLKFYVRPDAQVDTREMAADRLWEMAQAAPAGSDRQFQFVQAFAAHARTEEQLDVLEHLLDGSLALDGLETDRDLSWKLLTGLAAGGRRDEAQIDAAAERDQTSTGAQRAATAKASIPTIEAKEKVWHDVVETDALPNVIQRAAILGFNASTRTRLIRPFVDRYFEVIQEVWESRSHEISQQIIEGLFPQLVDRDVLEKAERFLVDLGEGKDSLRRQVMEGRDAIERALRVQSADVIG